MSRTRTFYPALSLSVGPSPATGYQFNTGFNNVYTGSNSGINLIQTLERLQSISDEFTIERTNINQLGQLAVVSREIVKPPTVNGGGTYYVADLSNERILGFYVSGDLSALTYMLDRSQAEKNYFISIAPQGIDNIGYTGQKQVVLLSNGTLASWSTEASVGNIPTTTFAIQGFNWATYTGSVNQQLLAINPADGTQTTGILFTIPTATSGISPTVAALRPTDITIELSNSAIGLNLSDIHPQSYNISFDLNLQALEQLGSLYPYSREPQFPVTLSASFTAYFGDLVTGSLRNVLCNDNPYNLRVTLNDPCGGGQAVSYEMHGMKVDSQAFSQQDVSSIASLVTLSYSTQIGSASDQSNGLFLSGRNISQ